MGHVAVLAPGTMSCCLMSEPATAGLQGDKSQRVPEGR